MRRAQPNRVLRSQSDNENLTLGLEILRLKWLAPEKTSISPKGEGHSAMIKGVIKFEILSALEISSYKKTIRKRPEE